MLLHCYPFVREAGWLAHVYGNVFLDLSLTIPHVARPATALAEALELAPVSKLLYASDAALAPELYLLAARWWRDALAEVLPSCCPEPTPPRTPRGRSCATPRARCTASVERPPRPPRGPRGGLRAVLGEPRRAVWDEG